MAADDDTPGAFTQTGDTTPGISGIKGTLGRSSEDLATNSPAGFGPDPIIADDTDTFSGDDTSNNDQSIRPGRKRNPDISPDERMGLRPTLKGDAAPNTPVNKDLYGA